jgi:hypothetical protein
VAVLEGCQFERKKETRRERKVGYRSNKCERKEINRRKRRFMEGDAKETT